VTDRRRGPVAPRRRPAREDRRPKARAVAITGTPGTGKSALARALRPRWTSVEVAELARRTGTGRREGRGVVVDLAALRARLRAEPPEQDLVVGHLAHLLPCRAAVVLRCHPRELGRRLARVRRGTKAERAANVVAEAIDTVLSEAVGAGVPVLEVDTTGRSARAVAREVGRWLATGGRSRYGRVDWLGDPRVTAHLLDRPG
jgi:adenylate kinase